MRAVLVKQLNPTPSNLEGHFEKGFSKEGVFHAWGVAYEEFENGPGNYSVAIVEFPDGTVEGVDLFRLKFKGKENA